MSLFLPLTLRSAYQKLFQYFSVRSEFNRAFSSKHDRTVSRTKYHCAEINVDFCFVAAARARRYFSCVDHEHRAFALVLSAKLCRVPSFMHANVVIKSIQLNSSSVSTDCLRCVYSFRFKPSLLSLSTAAARASYARRSRLM